MENYFYAKKDLFNVATDCIIFGFTEDKLKLLLFRRKIAPLQGQWSLIGSFVKKNEDLAEAGRRVLCEITGLTNVFMEELKSYAKVDRDPGARCISIAQYALIRINDQDIGLIEKHGASWHDVTDLPDLVLDHNQMVKDALKRLELKARISPTGFELLPEKFSMPQLQSLYEAIYRRELDSRNFRKKILSLGVLVKLNEKDKSTSKKGAYLYSFDESEYVKLLEEGCDIVV